MEVIYQVNRINYLIMVINEYYIVSANYTMDCISNILDFEINNNTLLCPICNNNFKITIDPELGEIICNICGIVLYLWYSIIWRKEIPFTNHANSTINTDLQHYDRNSIFFNIEYRTIIGRSNVGAAGKKISDSIQNKIDRLRIWDNRTRCINSKDRNLKYTFEELNNKSINWVYPVL
jgi:transcription initiation factor TFIIIB Brf1 subunit/transcription initiation factor TFIIB